MAMSRLYRSSWPAALGLAALALSGVLAATPALAGQKAFSWTHDDPELVWMDCPPFMPEGCGLAVLQGDPAEHNADVFFRLPPGTTAPRHWHTSAERMILIAGELHIGYDDQEPVMMEPGTYAYGPAELPHDAACVSENDCILFIAFEQPVDAIPLESATD
jgi:quercetin dioxygenase-like cupin family protein